MNPFKRLAGQTAIYGIPNILGRFLNYLLVPLYTYGILTSQEYGIVNVFYSLTALLLVVLTYGMETAFFRFTETEPNKEKVYSTGLLSLTVTSSLFLVLASAFSQNIARWIDYPQYPEFIRWFAWILVFDVLAAIPFARLRAMNRPVLFATIKSINILATVILNLFFLVFLPWISETFHHSALNLVLHRIYHPEWAIEYIFISNLLASLLTLVLLLPQVMHLKWDFDFRLLKRMLRYAIPLLFAGMAGIVNETSDRILLRYLLPSDIAESQVGIYSACYKIAILMVLFIPAYRFAAEPFFFSQMKKDDARATYARTMDYFIVAVSLIFLTTMLFLDTVFIYLIGPEFRAARKVIPVLMMAKLFLGIYFNLSVWYKVTGKTQWGAIIMVLGAVVSLGLNFYWIPKSSNHLIFGYLGSAWATFFSYAFMMVIAYLVGQKFYPIPYNLKKNVGYISLMLFLYFIGHWVKPANIYLGFGLNLLLIGIFAATVWMLERRALSKLR